MYVCSSFARLGALLIEKIGARKDLKYSGKRKQTKHIYNNSAVFN